MVEKTPTPAPNVVDFVDYQLQRKTGFANALQFPVAGTAAPRWAKANWKTIARAR